MNGIDDDWIGRWENYPNGPRDVRRFCWIAGLGSPVAAIALLMVHAPRWLIAVTLATVVIAVVAILHAYVQLSVAQDELIGDLIHNERRVP